MLLVIDELHRRCAEMDWDDMRFAYADPPYIGCANLYPEKQEVDHRQLLLDLMQYDAWALSTHTPGLKTILSMPECPDNVRIGAWVKPFASFKPNVNPAYAWEPIITYGGRNLGRDVLTVRDWVSANITLQTGMVGAKPEKFCFWLFEFMGLTKDDEFIDLYPGSGGVTKAWRYWRLKLL